MSSKKPRVGLYNCMIFSIKKFAMHLDKRKLIKENVHEQL